MHKPVDDITRFRSVDQATNPAFFKHFMQTSHEQHPARLYQQEMIARLTLKPGAMLLDVGCGAGQDSPDLLAAAGPHGRLIGIDSSETMLQAARAQAEQEGLTNVEYMQADAMHLPFADASFDGVRASRVLSHLTDPSGAMAEMVRVARPGSTIVVADGDLDLTVLDLPDRALTRKVIHAAADMTPHPWLGRQLPRLLQQAGLHGIQSDGRMMHLSYELFQLAFGGLLQRAHDNNLLSPEDLSRFWVSLEEAQQEQRFFAGAIGFIVSGQKPS